MSKILHLRDDIGRLYGSRKKEGISFASFKDYVDTIIQGLKKKKRTDQIITVTVN